MITPPQEPVNYLTDLSPKDKPWDKHKSFAVKIATAMGANREFISRAFNMNRCAERLIYQATYSEDKPLALVGAEFCRDRGCSICQWRRSLRWAATLHQQLPVVEEKYPTHRWLFLTLTVLNCAVGDLRSTVNVMNKAFKSLIRKVKKKIGNFGYIKCLEITRSKIDEAHPHFHVMLLVPSNYFTKNYIKQVDWIWLWGECLGGGYSPNVDIRTVKLSKKNPTNKLAGTIAEVMKYSCKPEDLLKGYDKGDFNWMFEYFRQIKGVRLISIGGILKGMIKAEWKKDEDLINVGDDEVSETEKQDLLIGFNFDRMVWRYKY